MDWRLVMQETPFGKNTRQNLAPMNAMTYVSGGRDSQPLPRVGYVARLHCRFDGTLNVTLGGGSASLDVLGPWNLISRIRLAANAGQDIYSVSGYGAYLVDLLGNGYLYDPRVEFIDVPYDAELFAAGVANGANPWRFGFTIPVAVNDQSELGLLLVQNAQAVTTLEVQWNAPTSTTATTAPVIVSGGATATMTGTFFTEIERFAVPADPEVRPDIQWIHQTLEFSQGISATGDNVINHLRDNLYLQIIYQMILNNAPNTVDLNRIRFVVNQSDNLIDIDRRHQLLLQRRRYHRDLPTGVFVNDFYWQGIPNYGSERDLINGRATSELQSILTIASGATLGTNPRFNWITRQLVKLSAPPVRQA